MSLILTPSTIENAVRVAGAMWDSLERQVPAEADTVERRLFREELALFREWEAEVTGPFENWILIGANTWGSTYSDAVRWQGVADDLAKNFGVRIPSKSDSGWNWGDALAFGALALVVAWAVSPGVRRAAGQIGGV